MGGWLALLIVLNGPPALGVTQPPVLESAYSDRDLGLATDPDGEVWASAPRVLAERDRMGLPVAGPPTEIRSRWTKDHLYLLFICPYTELSLKPGPAVRSEETPRLWHWDVVEAFIGSDVQNIGRYREFQASPRGEWADLDIDRHNPGGQPGARWDSGFSVSGRIDTGQRTWYAVMRIPFDAVDSRAPREGRDLRLGLFRIAGTAEPRTRYVWHPTGQSTFHVPEKFGILRLR
jgi:hypothetical protein